MAGGQLQTVVWRDAKGNTATTRYYVASGGTLTTQNTAALAIYNAMVPLTNASAQALHGPANAPATEVIYGTNAEFPTVEDKVVFTFQSANGSIHRYQIPAPKSSIFLADGETVDPANTDVVAYTSAVVANAFSRDDIAVTFGGFGIRKRVKLRRKLTIFTKDPTLTGPGE